VVTSKENFNEIAYLVANPDVAMYVIGGTFTSGWNHFLLHGINEGRMQIETPFNQKHIDARYLAQDVPLTTSASHSNHKTLIISLLKAGLRVLEVGSRCVTSDSEWLREACQTSGASYVGFDFYAGKNVDILGDAHKLSEYLDTKFDLIYSSAVFEHFAMPWLVSAEIAKSLSIGGHVFIETHFSYKSHERPWHFFQFSDMALRALFSPALGIECIEAGASNPMVGRFSSLADSYLMNTPIDGLYCHSEFFGIKTEDVPNFSWEDASFDEVTSSTLYPKKM